MPGHIKKKIKAKMAQQHYETHKHTMHAHARIIRKKKKKEYIPNATDGEPEIGIKRKAFTDIKSYFN